ncbi:vacuolar protein sorting/targeting protein 10 [Bimuria novae-zelandiae CBS 107.79]|uniref:Vacuolar protein sorting/targeting protein 10 n=1 Tax=Bimuria novae-zelandiae CBS 107.79 TaxID=1447943 RepID=A0A6A5UVG8_9PLEO|nr:vacuolar protein sorting/targeting protein 10 [Bimuria novae-zelandiae CBS 107.79]
MKLLKGIWLPVLAALAPFVAAKKDAPLVETTDFDSELFNIFYFDDSDVAMLMKLDTETVYRSADAGKTWAEQKGMRTIGIVKNPFDKNVAVVLGENKHWITYDKGEKWNEFTTEMRPTPSNPLSFHAKDNKKILFHGDEGCSFFSVCLGNTYYTKDGFDSKPKLARKARKMCMWAKNTERFAEDDDSLDDRILCITAGKYSDRVKDFKIVISDDYFDTEDEPVMSSGRTVQGMTNIAAVKGYFIAAAKAEHSQELAMYVTDDTKTWHHAVFGGGKIEEDAYTILESTNYSIQVDVVTNPYTYMGSLYTSNSNGTYFTKNIDHTNRNDMGYVDFEKVSNIQGIVLVNIVDNANDPNPFAIKKIKSQISFDDGRTFEDLKVKGTDDKLHLFSVTNLHNSGRVFSSPAPGIVMGVGNTGKYLSTKYTDGDLWVSDDAGLTWERALDEAHKYEFGGQGAVLVAVYDEGDTDKIMYSLKHGRKDSWKEIKLDYKIRPLELTTVSDSTSLKFILYASRVVKDGGRKHAIIHLDFAELHERKCKDDDFEDWFARKDDNGDPMCVMGHKQTFRRRKWDAECFLEEDFKEATPKFEPCDCDEVRDYECDYNFVPEGKGKDKKCNPAGTLTLPDGACKDGAKTYKGSSGWRKIPGNQCKGKTDKDKEVERNCDDTVEPPASGDIKNEITRFEGSSFREYYYLERPTQNKDEQTDKDETVVLLTDQKEAYISHDHGKKWKKVVDDDIVAIYPHQYDNNRAYFLTGTKKFYYVLGRGLGANPIKDSEAPQMPNLQTSIMQFHPGKPDWLIWVGGEHCEKGKDDPKCHTVASVSQKNGYTDTWETLLPYVRKCAFVWREAGRQVDEKEVFCEQHTHEEMGAPVELISSENWFKEKDVKFKSVVEFATMSEFIIVATKGDDGNSLKLDASLDAKTFAEAKFPPKFNVSHQTAYTVLDSSTHSVFLHVTVNSRLDQEYGSIIKSNSNGTSYVMSLNAVNRNKHGYVDFEKMQGIEGVAVANVVANPDKVDQGEKKKKQTRITHNDGADWQLIAPPKVDSDNKKYDCDGKGEDKCSLHLHGYTERPDPRESYSSPTAVGLMMGVGNVGEQLTTIGEASTFITTDAGLTWKEVKKGNYAWEFGDQGSVIVIVRRNEDTNHLYYSLDNGDSWKEHKFADSKHRIDAITTVPSDTSLNFLLWGRDGKKLVAINVDFSGLFSKKCELHENDPTGGDYDLWVPQHPMKQDDQECLFGHVAQYHRKKRGAKCYNGDRIDHLHSIARNCSCARQDFECDYNYERMPGGECKRIEGLEPLDPMAVCEKGAVEYWQPTGYRKIPISTCQGGREMEHTSQSFPCPGKEDEYERKHGVSGFVIFLAVVLPFAAAGGIGYYVWRNWDGKFGRIRLGESGGGFDTDSPWVQWPVAAISGLVAVVAAIPMLVGAAWHAVANRFGGYGGRTYTSRSSFARGRGDYAVVDPDEGELLGEDSDEDV